VCPVYAVWCLKFSRVHLFAFVDSVGVGHLRPLDWCGYICPCVCCGVWYVGELRIQMEMMLRILSAAGSCFGRGAYDKEGY
jgi:hypothetical protein